MPRILVFLTIVVTSFSIPHLAEGADDPNTSISVMTRNLYLGADVGVALNLLPDFPSAAQFMWDQMKSTDFNRRAEKLAEESSLLRPDVIAIQEATKWSCKKGWLSKKRVIFDFLEIFVDATKDSGVGYSLITDGRKSTKNPGFQISAIPNLTTVRDPLIFEPIFGAEEAACGFTISDVLLVRDDLKAKVLQVGNSEFRDHYSVFPLLMVIYRGYTWADLEIDGHSVRFVATHLESLFEDDGKPHSMMQGRQLVENLMSTKSPLIVMGDFNADPRDPRGPTSLNPGGQPSSNEECKPQIVDPKLESARHECNAYWVMVKAGFNDSGPDSLIAENFTWGASALLNGPDKVRKSDARKMGNKYGFTDRLDYIFFKNGLTLASSQLVSRTWPNGPTNWMCQVDGSSDTCFPSDHAGVFAVLNIDPNQAPVKLDQPLPDNQLFPIPTPTLILFLLLFLGVALILWLPYLLILKPRMSREHR